MTQRGAFVLASLGAASSMLAQPQTPQTQGTITYTLAAARASQVGGSWTNAPTILPFAPVSDIGAASIGWRALPPSMRRGHAAGAPPRESHP